MLTVEGERKVRQRFGLDCPDVPVERSQEQPGTPLAEQPRVVAQSVTMELSPLTRVALTSALGSASASSDSVVLGPSACKKLRLALSKVSNPDVVGMDSLARDD